MTLAALMLTCGSSDSAACARASTMTLPSGVAASGSTCMCFETRVVRAQPLHPLY